LREVTTRRCGGLVSIGDEAAPGANAGDGSSDEEQAAGAKGQQGLGGRELMEPAIASEAAAKLAASLRQLLVLPQMD